MPKIVVDAKKKILAAAKRRILAGESLGVRGIAEECGISVGSVYNYFDGKVSLLVAVMMDDWQKALRAMDVLCRDAPSFSAGITGIYEELQKFVGMYRETWRSSTQGAGTLESRTRRHRELMEYLSGPMSTLFHRFAAPEDEPMIRMMSEACLAATLRPDISLDDLLLCGRYIVKEQA